MDWSTVTVPAAIYFVVVWVLHAREKARSWLNTYGVPVAAVLVVASSATPEPVLVTGVLFAALITIGVTVNSRSVRRAS